MDLCLVCSPKWSLLFSFLAGLISILVSSQTGQLVLDGIFIYCAQPCNRSSIELPRQYHLSVEKPWESLQASPRCPHHFHTKLPGGIQGQRVTKGYQGFACTFKQLVPAESFTARSSWAILIHSTTQHHFHFPLCMRTIIIGNTIN